MDEFDDDDDNGTFRFILGTKIWTKNGHCHRIDGPAVIYSDGDKRWFLKGIEYDPMTWLLKIHEMSEKSS